MNLWDQFFTKSPTSREHSRQNGVVLPFVVDDTYTNLVHHINGFSRRNIQNPEMFQESEELYVYLKDLVSQRTRSGKPAKIALFTTYDRIQQLATTKSILQDDPSAMHEDYKKFSENSTEVFSFIFTSPELCTCKRSISELLPSQVEWLQNDIDAVSLKCQNFCTP